MFTYATFFTRTAGYRGTNDNNMKIRVWTVLWTIIRKARNHCQDVDKRGDEDHCQYHLVIEHCQTGNHCRG